MSVVVLDSISSSPEDHTRSKGHSPGGLVSDDANLAYLEYNILLIKSFGIFLSSQRMVKFKEVDMIEYVLRICPCGAKAGGI